MKLAALALAVATSAALAQSAPLGFKEFVLGAKPDMTDLSKRMKCRPDGTSCYHRSQWAEPQTIGGVPADYVRVEMNTDGAIDLVYVSFDPSAFSAVRDGFKEKYPGLNCNQSTVQNKMGARFDQEECVVRSAAGSLLLSKRGHKLAESTLTVIAKARFDDAIKQDAAAKKDL